LTPVATAGTANLKLSCAGSNTVLERVFATSPVKLFSTSARGTSCWIYAATLGGGFVGGDEVRMSLEVGAGATALLTTQASTKVYRSLKPARQTISGRVEDAALLAVVPDPVVCFADADFSQDQTYWLAPLGNIVVVDWMTSGRQASGERWMFERYASRIRIERDGTLIVFDSITLEHERESVVARMGRFNVCATVIINGPRLEEAAAGIVAETAGMPVRASADLVESASRIRGGVLVRAMGASVEQVGRLIRERLEFLVPFLGDDPWRRKW
jgi:urease accessory protein